MRLLGCLLLFVAVSAHADVRFLSPLEGSQVYGQTILEVITSTANVDRVEFYVDGSLAGVARSAPYRLVFDFGDSLASHHIAAHVFSNRYTTKETVEIRTAAVTASESIDVDLVEVPFRAVTRKSHLRIGDIAIRENGVDQAVREVLSKRGPTAFFFVVDRSLSMGDGKLQKALLAIERGLTRLRADDDAHVVMFNHRIEGATQVGIGEKITRRFSSVKPSGGTSLRDALASIQPRRRTVAIVISDGADRNSSLAVATALQKVAQSKLTVYALLLGGGAGAEFLETAARRTGGSATRSSAATLEKDMASVLADVNSRYTAVYQSRGTRKGWRDIQVLPRSSGIQIASARRGYYAE